MTKGTELIENWPELSQVDRPGRYLGGEMEARPNQTPDGHGRLLRVALAFPDVYEIAHGHLGHKIIYSLLNLRPGLSAERAYAPWPDWEEVLRHRGQKLTSLESRRPLADFDLIGFSLQYELGYTNILNMLELAGLPLKAADRGPDAPLVVAGGPGAYNPEPLADFFDLFFLGDAESSLVEDLEIIKEWKAEGAPKTELWSRLANRPGLYIPALFQPVYGPEGRFQALEKLRPGYEKVARAVVPQLEMSPFPLCQITPLIKPVHDRIVVEIGRGCSRGCRFCQAGYVYRPVRERSQEKVMELASANLNSSGQDEVSFLSLSAGDHTQISPLVSGFMDEYAQKTISLSLPSLRVKSLSGHLARQIQRVRKTGFTLAPEAGSQRLRDVINKDLTDDDLMAAAEEAFSLGWRTLKLYFMVGLPTETDDDLAQIAELARRLRKMSRAQLNLGVAHFTPKAHTPFQWHPASDLETINKRLIKIRDLTKLPGLTPKWNAPGASWVEAILARGDRRLGRVLARVQQAGARFEAWGDRFDPRLWVLALAEEKLDQELLLTPFGPDDPKPYDHLFAGVNNNFLKRELKKAELGETTHDCRFGACHKCGACHSGAAIDLAQTQPAPVPVEPVATTETKAKELPPETTFLINFKKEGQSAYIGHLELVTLFKRAFRRAGVDLAMSQGFHPQPKISFLTALPLGVPSQDEYLRVLALSPHSEAELAQALGSNLPGEVSLKSVRQLPQGLKIQALAAVWQVEIDQPLFTSPKPLHSEAIVSYTGKKGVREYPLMEYVESAQASNPHQVELTIKIGLNGTPKPISAASALWGLEPESIRPVLTKLATILDEKP